MAFESYSSSSNFVGKDGFHWWIGQVEKTDSKNKNSNRYKVRIVGHHLKSCEVQETGDLPWAQCIAPTTSAFNPGSPVTTNLEPGSWVIGFFMDSDLAQQPYILGSIGSVNNTLISDQIPLSSFNQSDPESCRAFTNFATQVNSANLAASRDQRSLTGLAQGVAPGAGAAPGSNPTTEGPGGPPTASYILSPSSPLNPSGSPCVTISQAECPTGKTASKLEIILSELFAIISQSGGGTGKTMTSKVTGYAMQGPNFVMGYIQKALSAIMQGFGWLKGELYYYVQLGVRKLVGVLLSLISDKGKPKDAKPPYDPKRPRKLLDKIQKFLEDNLAKIGCSIESMYDRLLDYLTKLLFGFVNQIWSDAFCAIDALVQNAMNAVQSFLTNLINSIMAPLQSILGAIMEPLNVIGGAIKAVFDFLGIKCSGLPAECKELIVDCGNGPQKKSKGKDFLDRLLADIAASGKPSPPGGICEDARKPNPKEVNVVITGGIQVSTSPSLPPISGTISPDNIAPSTPTLSILVDPISVAASVGDNVTFNVIASTSDNSSIKYQWQESIPGSIKWNDISGATKSSYTKNSVMSTDDGKGYRCIVKGKNTIPTTLTSLDAYIFVNQIVPTTNGIPNDYNHFSQGVLTFTSAINIAIFDSSIPVESFSYDNSSLSSSNPNLTFGGDSNASYKASTDFVTTEVVSYNIEVNPLVAKAGDTVTFTLTTENVANGTELEYLIFGVNLQPSDFFDGSLVGTFKTFNNKSIQRKIVSEDISFAADELIFVALSNGQAANNFVIKGSGVYQKEDEEDPVSTPVACDPIVSSSGKIVSIPVCDTGTQYLSPPNIFIQSGGAGYGASAVAVLDDDGFLNEIKVVRPGRGYPPAPPEDLDCIVTGFTIIKTGFGYDEAPIVYVDDDPNVAEAIVENGLVVNIVVKDKAKTYLDNPVVKIISTNRGVGAIAVANIACLERKDVQELAEVVGPTPVGEYIDCP
jgi:hypothetical protein